MRKRDQKRDKNGSINIFPNFYSRMSSKFAIYKQILIEGMAQLGGGIAELTI